MQEINYKKGIPTLLLCFFIWGFQPLYWYICREWDTYFLLACRIIWAAVCCLCILWAQGKLPQLLEVFRDKNILKREIPASVFLLADWGVYLWAVQNGRVLECSLGYYIQPIVVFILGAVIFREKVSWRHIVILAVVVVGIVLSTDGFNGIPYVTILLAVCFAIYAAIKRSLRIDSVVSTSAEIVMMVPLALLFILLFRMGDTGMASITPLRQLMLLGAGVVTAMPMVLYSVGVKYLPLMTAGFCQYLSPTLAIVCGMVMGEYLTAEKLRSFYFIWAGVLLYCLNTVYEERKKARLKP